MIVYFKLNIKLVKKFLERKKREQQIKLKHIKNIIFIKNTKNEKKTKKVVDIISFSIFFLLS